MLGIGSKQLTTGEKRSQAGLISVKQYSLRLYAIIDALKSPENEMVLRTSCTFKEKSTYRTYNFQSKLVQVKTF